MKINGLSPYAFACGWYNAGEIQQVIERQRLSFDPVTGQSWILRMPTDVYSREFAEWLAEQYRLAMTKGIELGMRASEDEPTP